MARVKLIQVREDVSPEHYDLFDELAARRGRISGPSTVVLHSPGLARPWNQVSEFLHGQSIVEAADAELAVCATARECDCGYIWAAHVPAARRAGVSEAGLDAVAAARELEGLSSREALVAGYARQLLRTNRVESSVFEPLVAAHGARWLVELTAWTGRYAALAGILNAFEVMPAEGAEPLPARSGGGAALKPARALAAAPRVPPVTSRDQVDDAGQAVFDAVAEGRGSVRGPFSILMHSPPLCKVVLDVSNYLRFESDLSPRLRELVTIATAREKDCAYVWAAHAPAARAAGVSEDLVAAIRDGGDMTACGPGDRDVIDFVRGLLREHRVGQALFDRLSEEHGVPRLVELTALIGHYGFVSGVLNAFEVSPATAAEALPLG